MPPTPPGTKAPHFTLLDQRGTPHSLSQFKGRPVVVYFYPKDDTEDCTTEACDFSRKFPAFEKLDAGVFGISRLDVKSKAKFAAKHKIVVPLLADETTEVSQAYGVLVEKSMYGKKYMGIVRTTFLIDAAGKVAHRWDDVEVEGHAEDVLAAVKALNAGSPIVEPKPAATGKTKKKVTTRKPGAAVPKTPATPGTGRKKSVRRVD